MKTGDILKVNIIDDNHLGNGIAKQNNVTIFVPKVVKGDLVEVEITDIKKNIAFSKVIEILKKSDEHIKVDCPYYYECGGCDLLHVSYDKEKKLKEQYIKKLFKQFDKNIISLNRTNYRNKVTFHVKEGKLGFYKGKTNELVEVKSCLLLEQRINEVIKILNQINLSNIKEIVVKNGLSGILIDIQGIIDEKDLKILTKNTYISSVYQNDKLVYGDSFLKLKLGNTMFNLNNNSFFQINTLCAKELYDTLKSTVQKCEKLLDLYCGTGSIGVYLHDNVSFVTGIEINKDSVKCAKENIRENNVVNYKIINSDASNIDDNYDIVIVDPPRSGLSKKVIEVLNSMKPKKIIYVSCNPGTLKRDIDLLSNYDVKDINIFNMFPATKHIESVVVLERDDL